MHCRNCPYGKEDFDRRMLNYQKIIQERGFPNDIYHYLEPKDAAIEFEQFIWCEKVGGKVYWAGYCEDALEENNDKKYRKSKK